MMRLRSLVLGLMPLAALACAAPAADEGTGSSTEDALVERADDHWFYGGPLPMLESPRVVTSLRGHTVRVSGLLPAGAPVPQLPHVRATPEGARTRLDVVYPIATARPGKANSRPGTYAFHSVRPYRPDGLALTREEGWHDVPWGGFPFFAYNGGIAFHGPITARQTRAGSGPEIWYLERGPVSGGCNRMMGEHVVEFTHILGVSMQRVYEPNRIYPPARPAPVDVLEDYDTVDGKLVDVDYPTHTGAIRPAASHGADKVVMFGSWVATETPDGSDLPAPMRWAGGTPGRWYDFRERAQPDWVCAVPAGDLPGLREVAASRRGRLGAQFCAKRTCVLDELRAGRARTATQTCGL